MLLAWVGKGVGVEEQNTYAWGTEASEVNK